MLCHYSTIRICISTVEYNVQGATVFIPSPGSMGPFTGRGYVSLTSFSSVQFIFSAPKRDQYELIIRFEVSIAFFHS